MAIWRQCCLWFCLWFCLCLPSLLGEGPGERAVATLRDPALAGSVNVGQHTTDVRGHCVFVKRTEEQAAPSKDLVTGAVVVGLMLVERPVQFDDDCSPRGSRSRR